MIGFCKHALSATPSTFDEKKTIYERIIYVITKAYVTVRME
jgi:hypothetical protein